MSSPLIEILTGKDTATVQALAWDTRVLGLQCARITELKETRPGAGLDYVPLTRKLKELGFEYVTYRHTQQDWARLQALAQAGFGLVDEIVTFQKKISAAGTDFAGTLRLATPADADAVAELSARTFTLSRFHNDPLLSKAQADQVHYEWGRNSCAGGAADSVWLVTEGSRLAGFITCRKTQGSGVIDLVAVDEAFAGRGIGRRLVDHACAWFAAQGLSVAEVQTQTNNFAAIKLYTRCGFDVFRAGCTLRWSGRP